MDLSAGELIATVGGTGGVTFAASWAVTQFRVRKLEEGHNDLKKHFDERLAGAKASKKASVEMIRTEMKEKEDVITRRIDKTQDRLERHMEETRNDSKQINDRISHVESLCKGIDGKLEVLINQRNT